VSAQREKVRPPRAGTLAEGAHFAVTIVLTVALAALLCYISTRSYVRMDWRSTAQQPLTADTLALLAHVETPVEAVIIHGPLYLRGSDMDWNRALTVCRQVLGQFHQACPRLRVSELDWSQSASQARLQQVGKELGELPPSMCVVFSAGGKHAVVSFKDLIYKAGGPFGPRDAFLGESAFAQAVAGLTGLQSMAPAPMAGARRLEFMDMPAGRVTAARYAFVFGIPACFIVLGAVVWLVRRR
jgi:hypothetical protein